MAREAPRPAPTRLPPSTCDSHLHVIGDASRYAFDGRRNYTPPPADLAAYARVATACGIGRAVLVQPSVYGTDNAYLLDTLRAASREAPTDGPASALELRGVVVAAADISDEALEAMHVVGVRGVRLNLVNPQVLSAAGAVSVVARMRHRGWHLQVQLRLDADGDAELETLARNCAAPIVIDHFGRPPSGRIPPVLLELAADGRAWVKLSAPYRSSSAPGHADLRPLVEALVAAAPHRLLWGSDWPHTELEGEPPRVADLAGLLEAWLGDAALLRQVCVDNPARLYDFHDDSMGTSP